MRLVDGRLIASPTDVASFLACRHKTALERQVAEGTRTAPQFTDPLVELLWERGNQHEQRYVGLLEYCKRNDTPHPSFVILDTPLRAYREPEGTEDDLRGTDLDVKFYDYLAALANNRQVIIIENTDPPRTSRR